MPLILAHLTGDFLLQPNSWVAAKERRKHRSPYLYLHVLLHTVLAFVLLADLHLWWIAALVGLSHFIIDWSKLYFQKQSTRRRWFFMDQAAHIAVILALSIYYHTPQAFDLELTFERWTLITGAVFLTIPASVVIKTMISYWTPQSEESSNIQTDSLASAGKYIGILERLLVFIFIAVNHWEGVGFMLAAKSVFRFSDLAEAKQRKLTEYVMIGTLLSFGIAIITGIAIKVLT